MRESHQYSNDVLWDCKTTYYLPGYLRAKVKHFSALNLSTLEASADLALIFTVYYGNISIHLRDQVINNIVLNFNRDEALDLHAKHPTHIPNLQPHYSQSQSQLQSQLQSNAQIQNNSQENQQKYKQITLQLQQQNQCFKYTIRKTFSFRIHSQIFWSPFEIINLYLTIDLKTIPLKDPAGNKWGEVKFNLMDHSTLNTKLSFGNEGHFGEYDLAPALMQAQYSNHRIPLLIKQQQEQNQKQHRSKKRKANNQPINHQQLNHPTQQDQLKKFIDQNKKENKKEKAKVENFQYAHFKVPMYKFPKSSVSKIFVPLWLLGVVNLGIFWQSTKLAGRFTAISTLMIALFSLIPTIRKTIPPNPKITFIEYLVVGAACTSLLVFFDSINVREIKDKDYIFRWHENWLFLIGALMNIGSFLSIIYMYFSHHCYWQQSYQQSQSSQREVNFNRKEWFNNACDLVFLEAWPRVQKYDQVVPSNASPKLI